MPRTKLDKRPSPLFILINGATAGMTRCEVGQILGMKSSQTVKERMRNPETLTVAELLKLSRNLHIPIEDLRQAITY
jgi:hypothetical protein